MNSNRVLRAEFPRLSGETRVRAAALRRETAPRGALRWLFLGAAVLAAASAARATDFYAAPGGSSSGTGSISSPWDLQTALNQTVAKPGDTIWLRGGVYHGTYSSYLNGTSAAPIVVRQYPGERATIDGGNSGWTSILMVSGSYTWYWGFEVMSSDPNRVSSQTGSNPTDIGRGNLATEQTSRTGAGLKFINLIIHDIQDAGLWKEAVGSEFYGSVIYYDGWDAPDRGHGHGLYLQNLTGTMAIKDNIIFENFQNGIQCYGSETAYLNNFDIEGNTIFNNGSIVDSPANNIIIGGGVVAQNPIVANNSLYYTAWGNGINLNMGYYPYGIGASNPQMTGNYSGNGEYDLNSANTNTTLTGNAIYSSLVNWTSSQYPSNTFYSSDPANLKVVVRPNKYEAGRANITVYNWGLAATVPVDVSGVLTVGQAFEVRNAQDWFGAPVLTGTYGGGSISLPMTGLSVAAPVGWTTPPASGPEFNVFVLLPKSAATSTGTAPDPHFSISPNPAAANQTVQFTDTSLNSPTAWSWNFGDAASTTNTSTAQNPTHAYAAAGTYTVRLTVTNGAGSASTTNTVTVNPAATAPVPSFSFSPSVPAPNQSTQFTDTSTGSPTSWSWTFGDGGTSTTESPTHVYASAGTYTVTLKASNAAGSASASQAVTVSAPAAALPDPHFSITPNPASAGQTVQFTDTTLNSPTSWSWNFGDPYSTSNTSTAKNPTHVYSVAGTYTIRLTATNSAGSASTTNTVAINAPVVAPVASFTAAYGGKVLTEQFTDTSTGSPTSWSWNFGDTASGASNTSSLQNPSHRFSKSGTYTVTLTVRNSAGSGSTLHTLTVYKYRLVVASSTSLRAMKIQRG
ncbi:MAG TPA: PKD domain-containing protein [Thermoanaerobaculia bacterium]|nr:PKD domain-containing protein [Thermoanaerobaculia bacterium]